MRLTPEELRARKRRNVWIAAAWWPSSSWSSPPPYCVCSRIRRPNAPCWRRRRRRDRNEEAGPSESDRHPVRPWRHGDDGRGLRRRAALSDVLSGHRLRRHGASGGEGAGHGAGPDGAGPVRHQCARPAHDLPRRTDDPEGADRRHGPGLFRRHQHLGSADPGAGRIQCRAGVHRPLFPEAAVLLLPGPDPGGG